MTGTPALGASTLLEDGKERVPTDVRESLLEGLTDEQKNAVSSDARRLLIVAGAGSGKTEVMARRVAWWVGVEGIPRDSIVAFTFTEAAAEEMKFRIRRYIQRVTPEGEDTTLGRMYVGTIHGFCLNSLRDLNPDHYHSFDVLDEAGRLALVPRGYFNILGLRRLQGALNKGQYATIDLFLRGYDLLNEYDLLNVELPESPPPHNLTGEGEWCARARLLTNVGESEKALAFAESAARYYAYLHCRRFLDFSTSQSELTRLLRGNPAALGVLRQRVTHLVVDEVQDVNPVQDNLIRLMVGDAGNLTAVGDHRQAIFAWRGARVDIMARLYSEFQEDPKSDVIQLPQNFRSTERIIGVANDWAETIGPVKPLASPKMSKGNANRKDFQPTHVGVLEFPDRAEEADWIAGAIRVLVRGDGTGAAHDTRDNRKRGLAYSDVAVLLRSSTDARTYMRALETHGIPAVFRAGPDLFSQPEVLLFLAALARVVGLEEFFGADYDNRSLPNRIRDTLGCDPVPEQVITAACAALRADGLPLKEDVAERLLSATELLKSHLEGGEPAGREVLKAFRSRALRDVLGRAGGGRRVFPQGLYHLLLSEAGVADWDTPEARGSTAMFHLGALSSLIKGIETPGWNDITDFRYQIIALCLWGSQNARTEQAPLRVDPDAVTITTIHSAKGTEYAAVFLTDVNSRRFPSMFAKRAVALPFEGPIAGFDPAALSDNENYDAERRLMYVALTRAERYLFVTCSGKQKSTFFREVAELVRAQGGAIGLEARYLPGKVEYLPTEIAPDVRLVTSFSDIRYFLECPHDFYLRKVLGFAPSIDQAFGYGRGVHNLLRSIHSNPAEWAALAQDPDRLAAGIRGLIQKGVFYLRYTTGEPAKRMADRAAVIVADYVRQYADELQRLTFEPESRFETLIEEAETLVSGVIDVVRRDDPPQVTLIDFKSGEAESDIACKLEEDEMRLQVSLYAVAARKELLYQPNMGLVRYLGEDDPANRELEVPLDDDSLSAARRIVAEAAAEIRERSFYRGPRRKPRNAENASRCQECDWGGDSGFCGLMDHSPYATEGSRASEKEASGPRRRRAARAGKH